VANILKLHRNGAVKPRVLSFTLVGFIDVERTNEPPRGKTWRLIVKCCCLLGFADLLATYLRCRFVHF
jgi:hypothetical protein